ncbi:hypothetical protein FB451DRAFT_1376968 [Mycena latifolia]|nr:hypothetical protein FB451DRAFT_1376968 [Mycena latifolia]
MASTTRVRRKPAPAVDPDDAALLAAVADDDGEYITALPPRHSFALYAAPPLDPAPAPYSPAPSPTSSAHPRRRAQSSAPPTPATPPPTPTRTRLARLLLPHHPTRRPRPPPSGGCIPFGAFLGMNATSLASITGGELDSNVDAGNALDTEAGGVATHTRESGASITASTKRRRTLVVFLRHFWCPLCQDYVVALASADAAGSEGTTSIPAAPTSTHATSASTSSAISPTSTSMHTPVHPDPLLLLLFVKDRWTVLAPIPGAAQANGMP